MTPPAATSEVGIRLFFTEKQFTALKSIDPDIMHPGYLQLVKQPNSSEVVPEVYSPIAGEVLVTPTDWKAVDGVIIWKQRSLDLATFLFKEARATFRL
ncbi:MAG TPA: hypothetical protein VF691_09420 [Cytophagaceae bacterium]